MTTQTGRVLIPVDKQREYSAEEFEWLEDDGHCYELIEGRLVKMPATGDEHGSIIDNLYRSLVSLDPQRKLGKIWITTGFNIGKQPDGKDNVPEPDLAFMVASRVQPTSETFVKGTPDSVVEVWSHKSDLGSPAKLNKARQKLQMYLNAGSRIAWGINQITRTVEVYYPDQLEPARVLDKNAELDGENIIPSFRLKVSELFG